MRFILVILVSSFLFACSEKSKLELMVQREAAIRLDDELKQNPEQYATLKKQSKVVVKSLELNPEGTTGKAVVTVLTFLGEQEWNYSLEKSNEGWKAVPQ